MFAIFKYLLGYSQEKNTSVKVSSKSTPHTSDDNQKQIVVFQAKSDDDDIAARSQLPDVIVAYWPDPTDADQHQMAVTEAKSDRSLRPNVTDDDDLDARSHLPAVIVAHWPVIVIVDDNDAPAARTDASPSKRHNVSANEVHISTPYVRTPRLGDAQPTPRSKLRPTPAPRSSLRKPNAMQQHSAAMASVLQSIQRRKSSAPDELHTSTPFETDDLQTPRNTFLPSKTTGPTFNHADRINSNKRPQLATKDSGAKSTTMNQLQPRNLLTTSSPFNTPRGNMHSTLPQKPKPTDVLTTPKQQHNHRQLVAVGCHKQNWTPRLGKAISPFATPTPQCRDCQRSVTPLSGKGKAASAQSRPWRPSPR